MIGSVGGLVVAVKAEPITQTALIKAAAAAAAVSDLVCANILDHTTPAPVGAGTGGVGEGHGLDLETRWGRSPFPYTLYSCAPCQESNPDSTTWHTAHTLHERHKDTYACIYTSIPHTPVHLDLHLGLGTA